MPISTSTIPTTTPTTVTSSPTTTIAVVSIGKVTARKAARGNHAIEVTGAVPHSTFAIRAVNNSRNPVRSSSWLVTADGNGYAMFFIKMDLSGFQLSIVR
jgi:hypothetical protein